jgi:hypothetical protein
MSPSLRGQGEGKEFTFSLTPIQKIPKLAVWIF